VITVTSVRYNGDGSHSATVRLDVTLSDGTSVSDDLGWPFLYRHDVDDPFTDEGLTAGTPVLLQLPPPGYDLAGRQKPATIFAVKHTDRRGFTDLKDCPTAN